MADPQTTFAASRWTVLMITILTGVAGLATLGLGIHAFIWPLGEALLPSALPTLVMILGTLVFVASFLGAFGAASEEKNVLKTYFAIGLALVIIQLVIAGVGLSGRGRIGPELEKSWDWNYKHRPAAIRNAEETHECCGFKNVTDRAYPKGVFNACLINPDYGQVLLFYERMFFYLAKVFILSTMTCSFTRECKPILVEEFRERQYALGVGGLVLAVLQGASLVPTYYLFHRLSYGDGSAAERTRLLPN